MVLGLGYDDLVAGLESEPFRRLSPTAQTRVAERGGKKIQSRGGPGGDDDLLVALLGVGSDQAGGLPAGRLRKTTSTAMVLRAASSCAPRCTPALIVR